MRFRSFAMFVVVAMVLSVWRPVPAAAQSLTTGDITGTVTDPTGAVVPNATVMLKNTESGAIQTRSTNPRGSYRFPLLSPGTYSISVSASGFQSIKKTVAVAVGQTAAANIHLELGAASQTIEVSAGGEVVQAENADLSTTISEQQVARGSRCSSPALAGSGIDGARRPSFRCNSSSPSSQLP
jgi:hypothetical protein